MNEQQVALRDADSDGDAGDTVERLAWVVELTDHRERLDKVLAKRVNAFSRSHLQALIALGHVDVDDRRAERSSQRVDAGQRVVVELVPTAQSQAFRAEPMALSIVHEDDDVLVLDKPAGLVVHPAPGHWSGTLMNGLLAHHAGAFDLPRAGIVHRLDKDTSGLMVVAKNLVAMTALVRAMAAREVAREYVAIAHGAPAMTEFTVDAPIGRDPVSRIRMALRADGKPARTDVECVASADEFSALRCRLHTGRTHQIRVHLASRGMPLVSDCLYGGSPALGMSRQALHAVQLAFAHPRGMQPLDFTSQPPQDFDAAWRRVATGYNRGQR